MATKAGGSWQAQVWCPQCPTNTVSPSPHQPCPTVSLAAATASPCSLSSESPHLCINRSVRAVVWPSLPCLPSSFRWTSKQEKHSSLHSNLLVKDPTCPSHLAVPSLMFLAAVTAADCCGLSAIVSAFILLVCPLLLSVCVSLPPAAGTWGGCPGAGGRLTPLWASVGFFW